MKLKCANYDCKRVIIYQKDAYWQRLPRFSEDEILFCKKCGDELDKGKVFALALTTICRPRNIIRLDEHRK